ncbi:MAG: hypothetical protein IJT59_06225 [Desulfovibrionaceae bacterium]|nr:hypothetical protein [Desulfovibrionaceae bacterium]
MLEVRLKAIPNERDQEIAGLKLRYSDLKETVFPLAVICFIPAEQNARELRACL